VSRYVAAVATATRKYKRATTPESVLVHATTRKLGVRHTLCGAGRINFTLHGEFDLSLISALACPACVEIIEVHRTD
jgi:hypothetical protein